MSEATGDPALATVVAMQQAWWRGDHEAARRHFSPDAHWHFQPWFPYPSSLPIDDAIARLERDVYPRFAPDQPFVSKIERALSDGRLVMLEFTLEGMLRSGRKYVARYVNLYEVANGKVTGIWPNTDTAHMARELGFEAP